MKKTIAVIAAGFFCIVAAAQEILPIGTENGKLSPTQTALNVDVTVMRQNIQAGPYARYAQKYLGVSAPLADKVLYEIIAADINTTDVFRESFVEQASGNMSHTSSRKGFPKLLIDRMSNSQSGLEDNARAAADQIFKIRRSRMDLITGEAGENVFGAGLESALAELARLEEEYLSLFLGKQFDTPVTKRYRVIPVQGKQNYIVSRFSETGGLLSDDDLSGEPIVLELKPRGTASTAGLNVVTDKPAKTDRQYRIADDVACRVICDNAEIASRVVPIYQFGQTVYLR